MRWDEVKEGDIVTVQGEGVCLVLGSRMHCRDLIGVPILKISWVSLESMHRGAWMVNSNGEVIYEILRGDQVLA